MQEYLASSQLGDGAVFIFHIFPMEVSWVSLYNALFAASDFYCDVFAGTFNTAYSQDSTSMHCSVAGYFEGQQEPFYADLAWGVIARNGLWETAACKDNFERGRVASQFYQEHREPKNEEDRAIAQQPAIFKAKVRRFILDGAGI